MPVGESDPVPRPPGHNAPALATVDMARAAEFDEPLGFACVNDGHSAPFTTFRVGDQFLNLTAEMPPAGGSWARTIVIVGDVDAAHCQAIARGWVLEFAPRDAPRDERYIHSRDPDGHEFALAHRIGAKREGPPDRRLPAERTPVARRPASVGGDRRDRDDLRLSGVGNSLLQRG